MSAGSGSYKVAAFLDTNIILECRPLAELPWEEIDPEGPILALVTATTRAEIDRKKQDGRLGKIARVFNRQIGPLATGGPSIVIRESGPRVELALSHAARIAWDDYDDLDREQPDARIVAEVIHARQVEELPKVVISHDVNPLALATAHELRALHVSDAWLRSKEPSPLERENQSLKDKIRALEATEPKLRIKITALLEGPMKVYRVEDLPYGDRCAIERRILAHRQRRDFSIPSSLMSSAEQEPQDSYRREKLPAYLGRYTWHIERMLNQVPFGIEVENTGAVHAGNLLIEVIAENGWVHNRYVYVSLKGPPAPASGPLGALEVAATLAAARERRVGRHDWAWKEKPCRGRKLSATCEDFRQGNPWRLAGVVGIDAHTEENTAIVVRVTASNMRCAVEERRELRKEVECVKASDLVDLTKLEFTARLPMQEFLDRDERNRIDFEGYDDDWVA